MKISGLKTMHIENPLGFSMEKPVFSWVVRESTGKTQRSARIRVAADAAMKNVIFDSGEGNFSSLGYEAPLALSPRTRYYWQVTVTADDGDTGTSDTAWFETGKRDEPWAGQWIAMPGEGHPILRRTFKTNRKVISARLYICGLGMYEASINGLPVSSEHFAPFYDSYNHFIQYQTYDVTALIGKENDLRVMLGCGWYMGRFVFGYDRGNLYGDKMQLLSEIRIRYADGTEDVIATGEDWQSRSSPVQFSSIYDGEIYDARLEDGEDWQGVAAADPPKGRLCDRLSPPLRVTENRPWKALIHTPKDEWVLDFGQVLTGWVSFRNRLPQGAKVYLQFGELLQEKCFYRENLRSAKAEYTYLSGGREEAVRPHFTFYGFRFVKVEGMSKEQILDAGFTAQVIHSDLDRTGQLETEDPRINRLIANTLWSQRGNFLDIPTDCPQRDERMGWTGDAQVFCPTACYHMYTPAFYRKYLANMRAEQSDHEGATPFVIPDVSYAMNLRKHEEDPSYEIQVGVGSCAWSDAAAIIPWTVYLFYGDKTLLRETYPGMKAWVEWIKRQDEEQCGGKRLWACGFHFADWLALDNPDKRSSFGGTDNTYIASAHYFRSASLTAKAAKALGYEEDAERYEKLAEEVKAAFRKAYFADGECAIQTQTALALALQWGLAPAEAMERTAEQLKAKLDARNIHLETGFVGTPVLLPALSCNGLNDYAVTLLLNEDYPSWLYEVSMGATTIWERWNSVMPNGLVSDTGMNSMNHYAYGSVAGWMYDTLIGLRPDPSAPGFKRAVIMPHPDKRLHRFACAYESAAGRYEVAWQADEDGVTLNITVPFDCEAVLVVPGALPMKLSAGTYHLER